MKISQNILLLFLMLGLGFSCVYESSVAIDKACVPIDTDLLYNWENTENGDRYTLSRMDDLNYNILGYNKANNSYSKMRAYASIVDGTTFLNVWDVEQGHHKRKYSIMKIIKRDAFHFDILPLTSNITEQFDSSEDLKTFIKANMMNSFFFEQASHFKRTDKKYTIYLTNSEHLLFISACDPSINENNSDGSEHKDKDVEICRSSILGQTYTSTMYRKENNKIKAYSFQRVSELNFDIGTYKWVNDSSISFKLIDSKHNKSETYTLSGYGGTTQIASKE